MPNFEEHEKYNMHFFWIGIPIMIALTQTKYMNAIFGYFFATYVLNFDLDHPKSHYHSRWGWLKWWWLIYARLIPHRGEGKSRFSTDIPRGPGHHIIFGNILLYTWAIAIYIFILILIESIKSIFYTDMTVTVDLMFLQKLLHLESLLFASGVVISNTIHLVLDKMIKNKR